MRVVRADRRVTWNVVPLGIGRAAAQGIDVRRMVLVNTGPEFAIEEQVETHVDWRGPVPGFYIVASLAERELLQLCNLLVA